jgi:hypothetical protein
MKKLSIALVSLFAMCVLIGRWEMSHASNGTDHAAIAADVVGGESAPVTSNDNVPPPEGWVDAGGQAEQMTCSSADHHCKASNYGASCGSGAGAGRCIGAGCCCPETRMCRSGSWPFCCPAGKQCTANGTPYLTCK